MNANRKPSESDVIDAKFALVHALAKCKGTSHSVVSHSTVTIGNEDAFECLTFRLRSSFSASPEVGAGLCGFVAEGRSHWYVSVNMSCGHGWCCKLEDLPGRLMDLERYVAIASSARQPH